MHLFDYLREMGGLHGALVTCFTWTPDAREIEFRIEDLPGARPRPVGTAPRSGSVTLYGVSDLSIAVKEQLPLRVFEFAPEAGASDVLLVTFWPAGWIRVRFQGAEVTPSLSGWRAQASGTRAGGR